MGIKYSVNEKFFGKWRNEMAYVLGYLYADGSLEDASYIRGKYVRVTSTDYDRIESIRALLESAHTIVLEKQRERSKQRYLLRIGNGMLFDALIQKGVTPRKSFTMLFPPVPRRCLGAFVRGYFDGDGCAHVDVVHGKPKRLLSIFTSGSKMFLESLHARLQKDIGLIGSGLYKHGSTIGTYQLRYSTRDSLKLFVLMYPRGLDKKLHLSRKYDIFIRYLKLRHISRTEIPLVLDQKGPMVKR
jgi:LAGLIDADG-like domain